VVAAVGVHRSNAADVVHALADVREELGHLDARLAVLLERERRSHERTGLALGRDRAARQRLPVVLVEHRLRIEAVDLREAAVHEEEDHALRARRMIEPARIERAVLLNRARRASDRFVVAARERLLAETCAYLAQRLSI